MQSATAVQQWRRQCIAAAVMFVVACFTVPLFASYFIAAFATKGWPSTQGRIISSDAWSRRGNKGTMYGATVRYEYRVGNRRYRSNVVSPNGTAAGSQSDIERIRAQYPRGRDVPVYYHTDRPAMAVLERGAGMPPLMQLMFALLPPLIGLIMLRGRPGHRGRVRVDLGSNAEHHVLAPHEPLNPRLAMNRLIPAFVLAYIAGALAAQMVWSIVDPAQTSPFTVATLGSHVINALARGATLAVVVLLVQRWLHALSSRALIWTGIAAGIVTPVFMNVVYSASASGIVPQMYYFRRIEIGLVVFGQLLSLVLLAVASVHARGSSTFAKYARMDAPAA